MQPILAPYPRNAKGGSVRPALFAYHDTEEAYIATFLVAFLRAFLRAFFLAFFLVPFLAPFLAVRLAFFFVATFAHLPFEG